MSRHLSPNGIVFLKNREGLRLKAYQCTANKWTIGYGHTAGVTEGMQITQSTADQLFATDVAHFVKAVDLLVKVDLLRHEFDMLVSLCFNIGVTYFSTSTLLVRLNANKKKEAANEFLLWRRAGGKIDKGLEKRRAQERDIFLSGYVAPIHA